MTPPVSEMPVAAPAPTRRTCGNCVFAERRADGQSVTCRLDARGFHNHPVPDQRQPAGRGGCLQHHFRGRP